MDEEEEYVVAQLAKALGYTPERRGFDSRWGSFTFFTDLKLPAAPCPGADSASTRYEYQEYLLGGKGGRYVRLTPFICRLSRNPVSLKLLEG